MAQNNFRITDGIIYIAKAGHDSNAGTINEPKKSIYAVPNATGKVVLGAGDYIAASFGAGNGNTFFSDGKVIVRGTSTSVALIGSPNVNGFLFINCVFPSINQGTIHTRQNCIFKGCTGFGTNNTVGDINLLNNVFINCDAGNATVTTIGRIYTSRSIYINSIARIIGNNSAVNFIRDTYGDFPTIFIYNGTAANFRNNNIQGLIQLPITGPSFADFAIQDQFTGTPQDNGYPTGVEWLNETNLTAAGYTGTVAGWDTAVATCINMDPKFNDISGEDFTLQSDSPHIRRAVDGINNIGGTRIARSVINTDDNGTTVFVEPSAEIDTTVPTSYHIEDGETEGTIDYIFDLGSVAPLDFIDLKAELKFDSDFAGGTVQNEDVPDSEPLTNDYALKVNTAASATPDLNKIIVPTGLITSGMWVRVAGEAREVTGVSVSSPNDTVTVASNFRAIVGAGVTVTYGTEDQLAALNPNRLTYQLRVSQSATKPTVDSDWDNDLDPSYGESGTFFTQEWGIRPVYAISGGIVYGGGDSERPIGATTQEIEGRWIQVRVYLRNNYSSNGL
jgi:hypothetical protein